MSTHARVLAVDDNPVFLEALGDLLGGDLIELASTTAEALRRLREEPGLRVILADVALPGGGAPFFERLRVEHPDRVVIAMSGDPDALPPARAAELGVHRFIAKGPATLEVFEEAVAEGLEAASARGPEP